VPVLEAVVVPVVGAVIKLLVALNPFQAASAIPSWSFIQRDTPASASASVASSVG
jgi:hypothetical protein